MPEPSMGKAGAWSITLEQSVIAARELLRQAQQQTVNGWHLISTPSECPEAPPLNTAYERVCWQLDL
jgi:hypothetical protein